LRGPNRNVFVNCPFDAHIRFDKLRKLVHESRRTIPLLLKIGGQQAN
jgi:hypothetical protein